jgi:hypothetical protein
MSQGVHMLRYMEFLSPHALVHDTFPDPDLSGTDGQSLSFGCDDCSLQHSEHCCDCVITYLCAGDDGSVVVTMEEARLVRSLQVGGLAPPLRYRASGSAAG